MIRKLILLVLLANVFFAAHAQINFSLTVSERAIGMNDQVLATYALNGASEDIGMPMMNFNDWNIVSGPNTSSTQSWINGKKSSSIEYSFVLSPRHSGTLVVPSAKVVLEGKSYHSNSATVEVSDKGGSSSAIPRAQGPAMPGGTSIFDFFNDLFGEPGRSVSPSIKPGQTAQEFMRENNFIKVTPSKQVCYLGEPILVTYELYNGIPLAGLEVAEQPTFNSAGIIEMTEEKPAYKTTWNGKEYMVNLIRRVQLIPLKTGTISLGNAKVSAEIMVNDKYGLSAHKETAIITNPPITINVQPLPPGKPKNFTGNIGTFRIDATVDRTTLPAGQSNFLTITISGKGNLEGIKLPDINYPANIQSFASTDSQRINKDVFPVEGTKTFRIPFIGTTQGESVIPSVTFSYFDNADNAYKEASTQPITLHFGAPLPSENNRIQSDNSGFTKPDWITVVLLALILLLIIWIWSIRKKKIPSVNENTNNAISRDQNNELHLPKKVSPNTTSAVVLQEPENFEEQLKILQEQMEEPGFYHRAKNVLMMQLQQLVKSNAPTEYALLEQLNSSGVSNELKNSYTNLLKTINKGLYLPVVNLEERNQVLEHLRSLINKS